MARIIFDTTPAEDAAIKYATDLYNADRPLAPPETPLQFMTRIWQQRLAFLVSQFSDATKLNRGDLYQKATPTDQATIDAILAKYQ
jgi:hypothetical protein